MRSFAIASIALALAGSTGAQYNIDPNSVPLATRQTWCTNQRTQCPLLCLQQPGNSATTRSNTCDAATLNYSCVCSNGQPINSTEYSQTIPFYTCQEFGNQCARNCGNNNQCVSACREDNPCGASDPERANSSTIVSTPTATGTGAAATGSGAAETTTANFDTFGSQPTGTNPNGGGSGAAGLALGQSYGLAIVVTGLLAGFGMML